MLAGNKLFVGILFKNDQLVFTNAAFKQSFTNFGEKMHVEAINVLFVRDVLNFSYSSAVFGFAAQENFLKVLVEITIDKVFISTITSRAKLIFHKFYYTGQQAQEQKQLHHGYYTSIQSYRESSNGVWWLLWYWERNMCCTVQCWSNCSMCGKG